MFYSLLLSVNILWSVTADSVEQKPILSDSLKEDVVVTAVRASDITPVSQYNFSKKEISEKYYGHDIPYLLQSSPSIVAQSDAGNGIGYSYFRLRGIDYTRINFNINGIPVNDAENQGFFTNNFADLASSAQNIQVQRGIGTTGNGIAPLAGSVSIITNDLKGPASFRITAGYGSYRSSRLVAEYNTGLLQNKFAFYGRISSLKSDGYRNNSGSDLLTYLASGGYFGKKSILKLNVFGGITRTQLAYYAIDKSIYDTDRKSNPLTPQENDEFQQNFYQLQYSYKFNNRWNISSSAYYVHGVAPKFSANFSGNYYQYANMPNAVLNIAYPGQNNETLYKDSTIYSTNMLVSYRLNQDFYGVMAFLNYTDEKLVFSYGIHANTFKSDHFMEILSADLFPTGYSSGHLVYFNTGTKNELSTFVKASYYLTDKWLLFGDLQLRNTSFSYVSKDQPVLRDTFKVDNMNWTFLNPKIGTRFYINNSMSLYASVGLTTREPTRLDLFGGSDYAVQAINQNAIKPERVIDIEIGNEIKTEKLRLSANIYLMEFTNEIAATGNINVFGYAYRQNVNSSFRRGFELSFDVKVAPKWKLIHNSNFSYNKIKTFTQTFSVYDENSVTVDTKTLTFNNVDPILTPNAIINQGIRFEPFTWANIELTGRYVSKSYLDNTNNENLTTPDYIISDLRTALKLNKWLKSGDYTLSFQLNNITNTLYAPSGTPSNYFVRAADGTDSQVVSPAYYPAATRNFFVTLNARF